VTTIFDQPVATYLSRMYITSNPDDLLDGSERCWNGQTNGICGAGAAGLLVLQTGSDTNAVPMRIEHLTSPPPLNEEWEDIVEVSFRPITDHVSIVHGPANGFSSLPLKVRDYRLRYCASGMDEARYCPQAAFQAAPDRYLLQFWTASPASDAILRQQSRAATHYHRMNTSS
jgi:hypothetical protein